MVSKGGCLGWLQKRTNLEKTLLSLSSLLLLTLLLMILIGVTYHGKKSENSPSEDSECWSRECIQTAGEILENMKSEADSCEDFYDYACGTYGQNPGQTVSVARRSTDSVYFSLKRLMESEQKLDVRGLEDVRGFYDTCVKFGSYRQDVKETGDNLLNLMSEVGVGIWPIIDPVYDTSKFSREHTLASLTLLDVPVAFQLEVVPDELLTGSYLIRISPGRPRETGRTPSDIRGDVHLRSSVLTSFLLLGASTAITDVDDIIEVDSKFAAIEQDKNTTCNDVILLSPQEATSELNRLMPEINWNTILSEIRNETGLVRPFAVELRCKKKIRDYVTHLNDHFVRTETNYLGWRFFSKFIEHVVPTFEKSQFGTDEVVPRWRVCLELIEKFSSPVLADLLTKEIISKEVQSEVERISGASLKAAKRLVSRARWLTDTQRSRILEKVSRIRTRYPFNRTSPNGEMTKLKIPQADVSNFTAVVILQQRELVIQRFRRLIQQAETVGLTDSWTPLLTAGSDSSPSDYLVSVYFDKIRRPYIRLQGSKWLNYGGFGVAVAREISRHLISLNGGVGHEESVVLWNLWSKSSNSSACLLAPLAARLGIQREVLSAEMEEKLLQNLFLDQSAIEIAYETAKSADVSAKPLPGLELSDETMFFLSYAQTLCEADMQLQKSKHIPIRDRLNSAVHNFETFNKVFNCAPSSSCQIWA